MSRPAVYQYVRGKDDAFRRLAERLFASVRASARVAAGGTGALHDRLFGILEPKLALTQRFAGPDGTTRFLEARAVSSYPWSEQVMAGTPAGPCATYPGDDTWCAEANTPAATAPA